MCYVEADLDKLLQAVGTYINEHFVPDSGICQWRLKNVRKWRLNFVGNWRRKMLNLENYTSCNSVLMTFCFFCMNSFRSFNL